MEGEYLYWLAYFYVAVWGITMGLCVGAANVEDFTRGVILGLLLLAHSSDELWFNPEAMTSPHVLIIFLMVLILDGWRGMAILCLTFTMFLSDIFWIWIPELAIEPMAWNFPHDHFYWQSILNLTFLAMCLITIGGCLKSLKIDRIRKRLRELEGDDSFEASEGIPALDANPGS